MTSKNVIACTGILDLQFNNSKMLKLPLIKIDTILQHTLYNVVKSMKHKLHFQFFFNLKQIVIETKLVRSEWGGGGL